MAAPPFERRASPRIHRNVTVRYRAGGLRYHQGQAFCVGSQGARIHADRALLPGNRVQLTLALEPGWSVATTARVVWSRETEDGCSWVAGVRFGPLWADDAERLRRWVEPPDELDFPPDLAWL